MSKCLFLSIFIFYFDTLSAQTFVEKEIHGLENLSHNHGVAIADYDLDGHLDFYVVAIDQYAADIPKTWSRLLSNNNDATFSDVTASSGLQGSYNHEVSSPPDLSEFISGRFRYGASWGDYNNDGYPDLFLSNYRYNKLYQNNTDGTFTDITEESGLDHGLDCHATSAMWFDYNLDGHLDLLFTMWADCEDNKLYENNCDGTFSDVSSKITTNIKDHSWMTLPVDVNDDGWPDILFINDFQSNILLINNQGQFTDETDKYGLQTSDLRNQMGASYDDVNNDGMFDIYVSDINKNALWVNEGGQFVDKAEEYGVDSTEWSWQTQLRDMDLDGDQDILVVNGLSVVANDFYFRNDLTGGSALGFTDQSMDSGFGERVSNAMSFESFDYDHDGDLDILRTQHSNTPYFQQNEVINNTNNPDNPNWVKIGLEGVSSNRSAIGTKIRLTTPNGQTQSKYYTGVGFMSQSLQPVLFGLGDQSSVVNLEVTWPNGLQETFQEIEINVLLKLKEGNGYTVHRIVSEKIPGCTDKNSCSYNPDATIDDGSCEYMEAHQISGAVSSGVFLQERYSYPLTDGHSIEWSIEGGDLLEGQGEPEVLIEWGFGPKGQISVIEMGDCYSDKAILEVTIEPGAYNQEYSVARLWNEVLLEAIRKDYARPTVHARNLFHSAVIMHDIYSLYTKKGRTYLEYYQRPALETIIDSLKSDDVEKEIETALSYALSHFMNYRFRSSPHWSYTRSLVDNLMTQLNMDPSYKDSQLDGGNSADVGNYIANAMISYGLADGANELNDYSNLTYEPINSPLVLNISGNPNCEDPNRWQPLQFIRFIDQSGNLIDASTPEFLGAEWGEVTPFALKTSDLEIFSRNGLSNQVFHNPGSPPYLGDLQSGTDSDYKWGFSLVSIWGSHLDPNDGVLWDISPKSIGNIEMSSFPVSWEGFESFYKLLEGGDIGIGRALNPVTNNQYQSQMVPRGDYTRVLAEFWADGPDSETPPGHWFTILNYVSDHSDFEKRLKGKGEVLSDLEWDIKTYFTLGGAMHDAAVAAWSIKGWYDYVRPISAIRYMAAKGQSTDSNQDNYHEEGISLIPDFIELVKKNDPMAGVQDENVGKIKLFSWRGHNYIDDPSAELAGVGWILAEDWWPYQRPSFVTPPFAGYVSGHSTFSRAAAEVLTQITGSEYFPGGIGEFIAKKNEFLVFENGPSTDVILQWATYYDASDQCSLSRIWGGIHPPADDIPGRLIGAKIGGDAFRLAMEYFDPKEVVSSISQSQNSVYPNPANPDDLITISSFYSTIRMLDLYGRLVPIEVEKDGGQLSRIRILKEIPSGVYILMAGNQKFKIIIR